MGQANVKGLLSMGHVLFRWEESLHHRVLGVHHETWGWNHPFTGSKKRATYGELSPFRLLINGLNQHVRCVV